MVIDNSAQDCIEFFTEIITTKWAYLSTLIFTYINIAYSDCYALDAAYTSQLYCLSIIQQYLSIPLGSCARSYTRE